MSHLQTAAQPNAEPMASLRVQPAGALGRSWIPKIAILAAMVVGFILANTQAAISLAMNGFDRSAKKCEPNSISSQNVTDHCQTFSPTTTSQKNCAFK